MYHMQIPKCYFLDFEPDERKWFIDRFVEQKKREHQEIEKAKDRAKKER